MDRLLSECREQVMAGRWKPGGIICPCCDGKAMVYQRPLNKTMARVLIQMYVWSLERPGDFRHVKNEWPWPFKRFNPEYARMVDLGLIEEQDEEREDGNPNTGYHRITSKGCRFVRGETTVPSHVKCYKTRVIGVTEKQISISDAMKRPFNYAELMKGRDPDGDKKR